jgi:hypothetical protein
MHDCAIECEWVPQRELTQQQLHAAVPAAFPPHFMAVTCACCAQDIKVGTGSSPVIGYQVTVNYVAMNPEGRAFDSSIEKKAPYDIRCCHTVGHQVASSVLPHFACVHKKPAVRSMLCDMLCCACHVQNGFLTCNLLDVHYLHSRECTAARTDRNLRRYGVGQVIPGLDEGLKTMKVGGIRRLYIPGDLAFPKGLSAAAGRPRVPPSSPVVFDVQLLYIPGFDDEEE